jgi:hypothetical protein
MRRLITISLVAVMSLQVVRLFAAGQNAASLAGTARTSAGRTVGNTSVRLRNVTTNEIAGTSTSNTAGQFSFAGLQPGTYAVEVLNAAGEIIGTSSAVSVAAGATITGITVTAAAAAAATSVAAGFSTAAIIGVIGAGAAIATVVIVKNTGSPSS